MKEAFLDFKRELGARFKRATVYISLQEWATIQYGIFDLNGVDMINKNLAQNSVAAAYDYEGVTDAALGTLDFGRNARQRINAVLDKSKAAGFMEMARGEDGRFQLMPKPEYKDRVTLEEITDQSGTLQGMRIDLRRGL